MSTLAARAFSNAKRVVVGGRWAGPDNFEYFLRFVFPFGLNLLG